MPTDRHRRAVDHDRREGSTRPVALGVVDNRAKLAGNLSPGLLVGQLLGAQRNRPGRVAPPSCRYLPVEPSAGEAYPKPERERSAGAGLARIVQWISVKRRHRHRQVRSEVPADRVGGDPAGVLRGGPENQDLRRDALKQPCQIVVAQPHVRVFVCGDDDPIELLRVE